MAEDDKITSELRRISRLLENLKWEGVSNVANSITDLQNELRGVKGENFDDLQRITKLEERLLKEEEEVDRINLTLSQIEDELYDRDRQILEAKMKLTKIFPDLSDVEPDDDERRLWGKFDLECFKAACVLHKTSDEETEILTQYRAGKLHLELKTALFYHEVNHSRPQEELTILRANYGDDIYHHVRKVWQEREVGKETGTDPFEQKPWNIVHDREMTLSEILSKMPWLLENEAENL